MTLFFKKFMGWFFFVDWQGTKEPRGQKVSKRELPILILFRETTKPI